jgi:hypothetical protein
LQHILQKLSQRQRRWELLQRWQRLPTTDHLLPTIKAAYWGGVPQPKTMISQAPRYLAVHYTLVYWPSHEKHKHWLQSSILSFKLKKLIWRNICCYTSTRLPIVCNNFLIMLSVWYMCPWCFCVWTLRVWIQLSA